MSVSVRCPQGEREGLNAGWTVMFTRAPSVIGLSDGGYSWGRRFSVGRWSRAFWRFWILTGKPSGAPFLV